jgi:hypothetical protein
MYYGHHDQPGTGLQMQQPPYVPGQSNYQDPVAQQAQAELAARSPATYQSTSGPRDDDSTYTVSVKVLSPSNKKDFKMYTLRNVELSVMKRPDYIKNEILEQIGGHVVPESLEFDLGYYKGKEKKWINNQDDCCDAVDVLKSQNKLTLWCTGVIEKEKRKRDRSGSESDDNATNVTRNPKRSKQKHTSAIKAKEAERDSIVSELRERHGTTYSAVQYRLWAEMKMGRTWDSLEKQPPYPMFGEKRHRGHSASGELNDALTGLAKSIVGYLSPQPNTSHVISSSSATLSPAKTAQLRSKYMEQLSDLVKLREIGALTNEEYDEQRQVIVDSMRKL